MLQTAMTESKRNENIGNVNALCMFLFDVYDIFPCTIRTTVNRRVKRATAHTQLKKKKKKKKMHTITELTIPRMEESELTEV